MEYYQRRLIWRLTASTNHRFEELVARLAEISEACDESYALKDEILSLPGHPVGHDPICDLIIREVIHEPSSYTRRRLI